MATLLFAELFSSDWYPIATLLLPVVLSSNASLPIATFLNPVVILSRAVFPKTVLPRAQVPAPWPTVKPLIKASPATSNLAPGLVVPMPTLPPET